jgi:hypothetical protein
MSSSCRLARLARCDHRSYPSAAALARGAVWSNCGCPRFRKTQEDVHTAVSNNLECMSQLLMVVVDTQLSLSLTELHCRAGCPCRQPTCTWRIRHGAYGHTHSGSKMQGTPGLHRVASSGSHFGLSVQVLRAGWHMGSHAAGCTDREGYQPWSGPICVSIEFHVKDALPLCF